MQPSPPERPARVVSRDAAYQHLEVLLRNRLKRHRAGEFLVQGVRPIRQAIAHGWTIRTLIRPDGVRQSDWAHGVWTDTPCHHLQMPAELLAPLAEKTDEPPELVAVVAQRADDLARLPTGGSPLVVVFDRPSQPGNIGSLMRSMDAFGASGLVVTGHAADPYDPKCIRASTGSFFAVPVIRAESHREVLDWVAARRVDGIPLRVVGADEGGEQDLRRVDLAAPTVLVIGSEARGMTRAWREACDQVVSIPMVGTASSLNAATAGAIVLHESLRQRTGSRWAADRL